MDTRVFFRSLSALSAYHSGLMTPMKMRTESQSTLRLYSGSPTRSDKEQVSISSFYYKERVRRAAQMAHGKIIIRLNVFYWEHLKGL